MPEQEKPEEKVISIPEHYIIHPKSGNLVGIDPDQLWFWTEEWRAGERDVDEHLQLGRYEDFDSMDDFLATL